MLHNTFLQDLINQLVVEVNTTIYDQCSRSAEPCKYVVAKELDYHTGIIGACWYCFYPFGEVVYDKENIHVTE